MRINSSSVIKDYETNSYNKHRDITNEGVKKSTNLYISDEVKAYRKNEFKYAEIVRESKEIYEKYFSKDSLKNIMDEEKYFSTNYVEINEVFDNKKIDIISKNNIDNLVNEIESSTLHKVLDNSDTEILQNLNDGELFINKENNDTKIVINKNTDLNKESLKIVSNSEKIAENNRYIKNKMDSTELSQNMQKFISEYNSLIDKVKGILSEQKEQKKRNIKVKLDDENIKTVLELRRNQENNEKKLKNFMDEIQNALLSTINEISNKLNEVGIKSSKEKNTIKLEFDDSKYKKAIEENGRGLYQLLIGFDEDEESPIRKLKDVFEKFANSNISIFANGINTYSQKNDTISADDIIKQEEDIKSLIKRMEEKENELGNKLSLLQTDLNKYDKQVDAFSY